MAVMIHIYGDEEEVRVVAVDLMKYYGYWDENSRFDGGLFRKEKDDDLHYNFSFKDLKKN